MSTKLAKAADNADSRFTIAGVVRPQLNKVFPTHWSFMLGEMALYSFIILVLTGIYLAPVSYTHLTLPTIYSV